MNTKEIAELDLGSLLQFDLLKKVIDHFLKEQKTLVQKVNIIEERAKKESSKTTKTLASLQSQINRLSSQSQGIRMDRGDEQLTEGKQIQDIDNNNNSNIILSPMTKVQMMKPNNEDNPLLSEVDNMSMNINRDKERSFTKKDYPQSFMLEQNPLIEDIDKKVNALTEVIEEIKVKVSEFDIYDVFKSSGDGDKKVDIDLVLIKGLEAKVFTKFAQLDEKVKLSDQFIAKIRVDLSNTTNKSDSAYRTAFQQKEVLETYMSDNTIAIDDLDIKLSLSIKESNEEMNKMIQQIRAELVKAIEERSQSRNAPTIQTSKGKDTLIAPAIPQETINEMQNELKLMLNKAVSESEKYVKGLISELSVDLIRKDISMIQKGLGIKLEKKDLQDIFLKFDDSNSVIHGMKEEIENMNTNQKNNMQSIEKIAKRSEFLTNLIYSKQPVNNDSASSQNFKLPAIDFNKYATQAQVNQIQSTLQAENDKLSLQANELKKKLDANEEQHKFYASEKDLRNMEQCLMNELDEYKLIAMKKFSDKIETQKNFRFLDLQIKHLSLNSKGDKSANNDTWLLAKKPVGMYQCASCESMIGDLNAKSDYIPWNRIQNREDSKKYRMGHGFSKMLQMVNTDLLKNAENAKEPHSDGEQTNENVNNSHSHNINKEEKLNANLSVSNIQHLPKILRSNLLDMSQEMSEQNEDYIEDISKVPKVVKIYRKLKKEDTQSLGIRGSNSRRDNKKLQDGFNQ